ncbi:hypothetical protein [Streptomyces rectiverticillatus]|uniref:hypothetical protein n=1 Tax=Streptomyces rectiverticillatus TaxID=173860 RepID=UPI0015C3492A|nr:hypothetical protein [Streptomyces rectiverticillatus]
MAWMAKKSVKVTALSSPVHVRAALESLQLKLNGELAAANTVKRKETVFTNALRFAIECELLPTLPTTKVDWEAPEADDEVDFRFVAGPRLSRRITTATGDQGDRGRHLLAFFGCLYYAAARPAEITALTRADCNLPETGWGELLLSKSAPRIGSAWTNTGESFDSRGLKRRAHNATHSVPIPPALVRMLLDHIAEFGVAEDGRLFRAARGGHLLSKEYGEIWKAARLAVLSRPRPLRHSRPNRTHCATRASPSG